MSATTFTPAPCVTCGATAPCAHLAPALDAWADETLHPRERKFATPSNKEWK